jgi:YbbR domain-containing protein
MRFLLRHWHLKLSAVLLATVLYTGLVFSGSFSDASISLRIEQENASRDVYVLTGDLGPVEVDYRVLNDESATVNADAFTASVDLSEYDMERAPQSQQLPVEVTAGEGIEILSFEPRTVRVELDRVGVRSVPVEVDPGTIPRGLEIDPPEASVDEVQVRGPASVLDQIDRALALITIDASGIDFNEPVNLTLVDIEGQPVGIGTVDVEPEIVSVQVDVRAVETEITVPVRPDMEPGAPAAGFALAALSVDPAFVTLSGLPEDLSPIEVILTEPLSIDGASEDQVFDAELQLPDGASLVGGDEPVVTVTATIVPSVSGRTFVVGVLCQGAGENACLPRLQQLTLTLSGPGGALAALDAADLTPIVDASGLAPGSYNLAPSLPALPQDVELVGMNPTTVPVTIQAPAPTPAPG